MQYVTIIGLVVLLSFGLFYVVKKFGANEEKTKMLEDYIKAAKLKNERRRAYNEVVKTMAHSCDSSWKSAKSKLRKISDKLKVRSTR